MIDAVLAELDDVFDEMYSPTPSPHPTDGSSTSVADARLDPECADEALELIEAHVRVVGLWAGVVLPTPSTRNRRRTRAIAQLRVVAAGHMRARNPPPNPPPTDPLR